MPRMVGDSKGYRFDLRVGTTEGGNGRYNPEVHLDLPSVSTVSGALTSDALMRWQYSRTRDSISGLISMALEAGASTEEIVDTLSDYDMLEEWLSSNEMRPSDIKRERAEIGRKRHDYFETLGRMALDSEWGPDDAMDRAQRDLNDPDPWIRAIAQWWVDIAPRVLATELVVYRLEPHGGYAGQLDFYGVAENRLAVIDLKTRKAGATTYPKDFIQGKGYAAAIPAESPIDVAVLVAREDGEYFFEWCPKDITEETFFALLKVYNDARGY